MRISISISIVILTALGALLASPGCKGKKKQQAEPAAAAEPTREPATADLADAAPPPRQPPPATAEEAMAAIATCRQAATAGEHEVALGCYASGARFQVVDAVLTPGSPAGDDGESQRVLGIYGAFTGVTDQPQLVLANGNSVATVVLLEGTHEAPLWGLPASGKKASLYLAQIAQVASDGTLTREDWYVDQATVLHQLGVRKAKRAPGRERPFESIVQAVAAPGDNAQQAIFRAFNQQYLRSLQTGDAPATTAAYAKDAELRYTPEAKVYKGPKAIAKRLAQLVGGEGRKLNMRRQWSAGDWIVAETMVEQPATEGGSPWYMSQLELLRYADGAIAEHWIFANELKRATELGDYQAPAPAEADPPAADPQ